MTAIIIFVILWVLFSFWAYYKITSAPQFAAFAKTKFGAQGQTIQIYLQRLTGVLFFGILPFILVLLFFRDFDMQTIFAFSASPTFFYWLAGFSAVMIPANIILAKKPMNLEVYPQVRTKNWTNSIFIISALTWTAYLFAYEFLIRGLLFFTILPIWGFWTATLINIILYSIVHIPKGKVETIGAIPLGLLLCLAVYQTGNFWIAFLAHVVQALGNEWASVYWRNKIDKN